MGLNMQDWKGLGLLMFLSLWVQGAESYFKGDPVQTFKRMQMRGQRTMWSDVLVGQQPLFAVDKAVELHVPSNEVPAYEPLKVQLSYDHEKFNSEWITLADGEGHQLEMIMAIFIYSGSEIHEVHHRLTYRNGGEEAKKAHKDRVTIAYHWIPEVDTDTRSGLNFLFISGIFLTLLAALAVVLDSGDLASNRALLVPEYEETDKKRPKVKKFTLYEDDTETKSYPSGRGSGSEAGSILDDGLRARGGAPATGADAEAPEVGGKKGE